VIGVTALVVVLLTAGRAEAQGGSPAPDPETNVGSCRPGYAEGRWQSVAPAGAEARVWWSLDSADPPRDRTVATGYARALTEIWPKLTRIMRRRPPDDAGEPCHGPDGKLDIWIVPLPAGLHGITSSFTEAGVAPPPCEPAAPSYIKIANTSDRWILAHEFMHTIQGSYPLRDDCRTYLWLEEAIATWGANAVYLGLNKEKGEYLNNFALPLDCPLCGAGAWVFFYYVTQRHGSTSIPRIWERAAGLASVAAVNAAVPGQFNRRWAEFSLYAWNQRPIGSSLSSIPRSFRQWPAALTAVPRPLRPQRVGLGPVPLRTGLGLLPLTRRYYHLTFPDRDVRRVIFRNTWAGTGQNVKVQAFVKIGREWRRTAVDWTGKPDVSFCRNRRSQDVRELIVTVSRGTGSSDPATHGFVRPGSDPQISGHRTCSPAYSVTFTGSAREHHVSIAPSDDCGHFDTADQSYNWTARYPSENHHHAFIPRWSGLNYVATEVTGSGTGHLDHWIDATYLNPCRVCTVSSTMQAQRNDNIVVHFQKQGTRYKVIADTPAYDSHNTTSGDECEAVGLGTYSQLEGYMSARAIGRSTITVRMSGHIRPRFEGWRANGTLTGTITLVLGG
jgi:hypothetical protein